MEHQATWQDGQIIDTPIVPALRGRRRGRQVPYRDVQVEYPPLAFAVMLPPRLAGSYYESYTSAFSALMGPASRSRPSPSRRRRAASGARAWLQAAAGAFVAVGPALAGSVSLTRFDLWPVALVALRAVGPRRAARRHGRRAARPRDRRQAVAGARAAGGCSRWRCTPRLVEAHDARCGARRRGAVRVRARTLAVGPVARPVGAGEPAAADREPRRVGPRLARSARRGRPVLRRHVVRIAEPDRGLGRGRRGALDARAASPFSSRR